MARPRFYRSAPAMQAAILKAAACEFASDGYQGASLNQIIEAAGLSKGAFYYYFDDKADLAATVLQDVVRPLLEAFEELELPAGNFDFWGLVETMARDSLERLRDTPEQTDVIAKLASAMLRDTHLASHLAPLMKGAMKAGARLWQRGQEMGMVRADLPLETLLPLLQGIKETLARVLLPVDQAPSPADLERFIDLQMDLFRRVARREPREKAARSRTTPRARRASSRKEAP
jgi:AcrR family transcriptional regulator